MSIVGRVSWWERRKLMKLARRAEQPIVVRRALAVVQLGLGRTVTQVAESMCAARSSVYVWGRVFRDGGVTALATDSRGSERRTMTPKVLNTLSNLLERKPPSFGYLRTRWSSELLAKELYRQVGIVVHSSTVRRALGGLDWVWRRARPTLHIADPRKAQRLRAIHRALASRNRGVEVFYQDEADVDLNPRIGPTWCRRGQQEAIPTPGTNRKAYISGALHARTGKVVWVGGTSKNTDLFIAQLEALERAYPKARRLVLILDNYGVHKSKAANRWLDGHPKFELLFQPVYHPWVNRIERLWKAMHDTVTRNHRCRTLEALCRNVAKFMDVVQPFPGAGHATAFA